MPLLIMKLAMDATSVTSITPTATRFFTITPGDIPGGSTFTVDTADFFDDAGNPAATLPALNPDNSTINLYINGVLQMTGIYSYTPGATGVGNLLITVPAASSILAGSPVVLEITNYTPTSTTDVAT